MSSVQQRSGTPALWLAALVALGVAARALRGWSLGFPMAASDTTRLSLAEALWEPHRLDFVFQGVHPGWLKSPLFPLTLAPAVPAGALLPACAHLLTGLCLASLALVLYLILAPRAGRRTALAGATAVALLPPLLPYAGEYALAALLLGLAAALVERGLRSPSMPLGAALGAALALLAAARWEGVAQAALLSSAWAVWASRRPRARLPSLALGALVGLLIFGALQLWAYPDSTLIRRIGERLGITAMIVTDFAGQAAQDAAFDGLRDSSGGVVQRLVEVDVPGPRAWSAALGASLQGVLEKLAHPLLLPWLAAAALGLHGLGRRKGPLVLTVTALFLLPAAVMPFKPQYLLPGWLVCAALAGLGWARLEQRRRPLAYAVLGLAGLSFVAGAATPDISPGERARLRELRAIAAQIRAELEPEAELQAPEDLCVLLMAHRGCRVGPTVDGVGGGWWVGEREAPPRGCTVTREAEGLTLADCRGPKPGQHNAGR